MTALWQVGSIIMANWHLLSCETSKQIATKAISGKLALFRIGVEI
jgi:hypothetical protein